MKKILFIPLLILSFSVVSQNTKTILEIDDEKVSFEEFKRVYLKNNSGEIVSKSTVDEYLELYINFKLKVKESEARGMDKDESFISELAGYRAQLAQPYLSEDNMLAELKKEAYERLKFEINASHILINSKPGDSPDDTLKAYQRALKIRKSIVNGLDFNEVAKSSSEDPSAKQNGGDLGYFTGFYMVYPFESAAYNTKVGDVSMPVRTRFGYHLIKVNDKRPSNGTMNAAHILISKDPEIGSSEKPEEKAKEVIELLQEGDSFEELAKQYSDDTRSANNGGLLPPFSVGRMVKGFEVAAFSLKKDGDISKPIETKYGWHIIKRISKEPLASYESIEKEIEGKVKKDSRSNLTEGAAIRKVIKEYGFKEFPKELEDFKSKIDPTYYEESWDGAVFSKLNKTMFTIGKEEVNQIAFTKFLVMNKPTNQEVDVAILVDLHYKAFKQKIILDYKDSQLESEYPEFKSLVQEYHDGILLFNLTDELVWSKAVKDTLGLEAFYNKNKENYKWSQRVDAVVFSAANEDVAKATKKMLKEGREISEIIEEINRPSQLNLKKESKKYEKGENEIIDEIAWESGISKNVVNNGRLSFVQVKEVLDATYKTLEDSKGIITSDYQEFLEKEWIEELRGKYQYKVNASVLEELKAEVK
jgi:peptidyl-prolyl cis-trans isomerase SurA